MVSLLKNIVKTVTDFFIALLIFKLLKQKKPKIFRLKAFDLKCSGEQDRTADLRVMNPAL